MKRTPLPGLIPRGGERGFTGDLRVRRGVGRTGPRERTQVRRNAPGHGLFERSGLLVFGLDHDVERVWLTRHFLDFDNKPDHARSLARARGRTKTNQFQARSLGPAIRRGGYCYAASSRSSESISWQPRKRSLGRPRSAGSIQRAAVSSASVGSFLSLLSTMCTAAGSAASASISITNLTMKQNNRR